MKLLILGATGLCAGGTAWYMADSPDFDRIVKKSPAQVYAAFSQLAQEGTVTPRGQGEKGPRISFRVDKVNGQSIHYEVQFDQRPAVQVDLAFAAAGEGGAQTRMTGELNVDTAALGGFETEGGMALSLVQNRTVDASFARFMDRIVDDLEAGRPLRPLRASDMGVRESAEARTEANPRMRRARAEAQQRAASRPMTDARPMVDPNRAADQYLNGGRRDGSWGR